MSDIIDTRTEQAEAIRRAIRTVAPKVRVTQGTGTARWWIDVWSPTGRAFTAKERSALTDLGFGSPGLNCLAISPEQRISFARRLGVDC